MEVSHTPVDKPVVAREPVDQSGPQGGRADTVVYCWSYARRPLPEICESNVSEIAAEGLRRTAQPYAIEARYPRQSVGAASSRAAETERTSLAVDSILTTILPILVNLKFSKTANPLS